MTSLRRPLAPLIAIACTAAALGCAGDGVVLPGDTLPAHIAVITGDAQAGIAGTALSLPVVVKVTDDLDRPVPGQTVEFTVVTGGGQLAPGSVETDAQGRASSVWTLGPNAGAQQVKAQVVGDGAPADLSLAFNATAVAGSGSLITAVSGDDQSAPVNSALAEPLVVKVGDGLGNPVSGVTIQWTAQGGGSISPETVVTGEDGLATAERVLGPTAGQQSAQASVDGLAGSPVTFVHTALPSNPTLLTKVSGDGQTAPAGFEVTEDLVVKLTDDNGNGVGGAAVTWVVATGGGTVEPINSITDPSGFARTRWKLGSSAGANTLNAVFSGLPAVPFSATASADVPTTIALVSGNNQTGTVGQQLASPLVVKVTDGSGNPVENVSVSWAADGGGSVSSATSATNAAGLAQVNRTLGLVPGSYSTTAAVPGLSGSPVTFTSTANIGAAAKLVIITEPGASVQSGALLSPQPTVQVQDLAGNNVPGAGRTVTATIVPATATLGGDRNPETDANGLATFTDLTVTGPAGNYTIRFNSGALIADNSNQIVVGSGTVSAAQSTVDANPASVGVGVASTITVTAKDGGGNPVAGATVTISATGSGNSITQPASVTDANGQTTGTFSSSQATAHTINATINGIGVTDNATVTVSAGSVSASTSTVQAAPPSVAAGATSTITVTARDASGNPVAGATVVLAATGSGNTLNQPAGPTNASGQATGTISSTATGTKTITATIDGTPITDDATVTVTAGGAANIAVEAGNNQTAAAGAAVATDPSVKVTDGSGNPVSGVQVVFAVASGGGSVTGGTQTTNGSGIATVGSWTLGPTAGTNNNTLTATASGSGISGNPVTFTASATAGSATQLSITTPPPGTAQSGVAFTTQPQIQLRDGGGNPVSQNGVTITATINSGPGGSTLTSATATTNGSGLATFSGLRINGSVGTYTLDFDSGSLTGATSGNIVLSAGPVSGGQSTVDAAPATVAAGDPSTITVTARDASNNPIAGATVTISASPSGAGNTVTQPPSVTDANGQAVGSFSSTDVNTYTITATIDGTAVTDNASVVVQ